MRLKKRNKFRFFSWMSASWRLKPCCLPGTVCMCWKSAVSIQKISSGFVTLSTTIWRGAVGIADEFDWPVEVTTLSVVSVPLPAMKTSYRLLTLGRLRPITTSLSLSVPVRRSVCMGEMAWKTREWWTRSDTWPLKQPRINGLNRQAPLERCG